MLLGGFARDVDGSGDGRGVGFVEHFVDGRSEEVELCGPEEHNIVFSLMKIPFTLYHKCLHLHGGALILLHYQRHCHRLPLLDILPLLILLFTHIQLR